jgi:quinol---cytochrome c reductase iron-sulfur subunit, bacillus type
VATSGGESKAHSPLPSLWPVGFAIGIACILVGLVVSLPAVIAGAVIALVFGFLWARDATRDYRVSQHVEPEGEGPAAPEPAAPAQPAVVAPAAAAAEEPEAYPRSVFLELSTLGLGAAIGAIVTLPPLGFAVIPAFENQKQKEVDVGKLENFPEGKFIIATFLLDPSAGEVSRRTAYIRNNGLKEGLPSFTIISNRCVHLGCPVQPGGPITDEEAKTFTTTKGEQVTLVPTLPANFSCPCHGGAYDTEGNRVQGPPVRALDRYSYGIKGGRLILLSTFSVGKVEGTGADAMIQKYDRAGPGQHVDGPEAWLYPILPSQFDQ